MRKYSKKIKNMQNKIVLLNSPYYKTYVYISLLCYTPFYDRYANAISLESDPELIIIRRDTE